MNAVMRRVVRRTSIGLGALALAAGAAACGGGGGEETPPEQDPGIEEPAPEDEGDSEEDEASDAGGDDASDAGGDDASDTDGEDPAAAGETDDEEEDGEDGETAAALSEEDMEAAKQRFVEFIQAVDEQDAEAACSYLLNPETGETGEGDAECVDVFQEDVVDQIEGGEYAELDTSMVTAEDNGDGSVTVGLDGQPFPLPLVEGEDGEWYLTGPSY